MRRDLIIMANSRKMQNRCIAGIDVKTGEWIRPVYKDGHEGVPWSVRQIQGAEPQLLDIVSIPLADDGPYRDIQPENRTILDGAWEKVGKATVAQVKKFCQTKGYLLHCVGRSIHISILKNIPDEKRQSLCLIEKQVNFSTEGRAGGKKRVNASFSFGGYQYVIPVTDYIFEKNFPAYSVAEENCLLTISLGLPFELDNRCYKFVAGVIVL